MSRKLKNLRGTLQRNHGLAPYTSWKIGGPAEYFYRPEDVVDLAELLRTWHAGPITILGAATNVLIRAGGIKGLVVYLRNSLQQLKKLDDLNLWVEAGASLAYLVQQCSDFGMSDAAFMAGIPGTVGGALKMNAGAYGDCIWNHVVAVETINRLGEIKCKPARDFQVGYRTVDGLHADEWFVAAQLTFACDEVLAAKQKVKNNLQKRMQSQPLNLPSCGSVFRNPVTDYAARLIEVSGFKGRQIGGARVSEKHANFIVNCGHATAGDVETLMQEIILGVRKNSGVDLVPEVQILGLD